MTPAARNKKLAANLFALVAGMLMLAYASAPLYRMFCATTGYGGTTQRADGAPVQRTERTVRIEFNADHDPGLNWEFSPGERSRTVQVGEQALTYFVAHNLDNAPVTGRAVYNVVPFKAGAYFDKVACFCFTEQTLAPGQRVDMPVSFYLDPALLDDPDMQDVKTITLSYTFFPVKK